MCEEGFAKRGVAIGSKRGVCEGDVRRDVWKGVCGEGCGTWRVLFRE